MQRLFLPFRKALTREDAQQARTWDLNMLPYL